MYVIYKINIIFFLKIEMEWLCEELFVCNSYRNIQREIRIKR